MSDASAGRLKRLSWPIYATAGSALKEAAALTVSRYVDQSLTLLTPMLLVRTIDPAAFGEYRLFWLVGTTVALLAPLGIPNSLLYFFPRLDAAGRARFLGQALLFMSAATLAWAGAMFAGSRYMPAALAQLLHARPLEIFVFVVSWTISSLLDTLPIAAGKVFWQARATVAVSVVRTFLLLGSAFAFRNVDTILLAVTIFTALRTGVLFYFIWRNGGIHLFPIDRRDLSQHVRYSVPFGFASLLFSVRRQAEQWIAASLFSLSVFGAFSIAISLLLPFDVLRTVISSLLLPRMSRAQLAGADTTALEMNRRANVITLFVIMPAIAFLFWFAKEIVSLLFTARYLAAVPVLRIYLVQAALTIEFTTILNVHRLGRFQISYAVFLMPLSIACSCLGAIAVGLPGAALGSLLAQLLATAIVFGRLSRLLNVAFVQLQDWRTLLIVWGSAIVSGALASVLLHPILSGGAAICFAGLLFTVGCYLALLFATGRSWILKELFR